MKAIVITPRVSETDMMGHIGNTVPPVWLEQGRTNFLNAMPREINRQNWPFIIARVEVDYKNQLFVDTDVTVKTGLERIGAKSFSLRQEIWQNGRLAVAGRAVMVHFHHADQKSSPIPDDIRRCLEATDRQYADEDRT